MSAILLQTKNKKQQQTMLEIAKLVGLKIKIFSDDEMEDFVFGTMIKEAKTGETVSKNQMLKLINSHES